MPGPAGRRTTRRRTRPLDRADGRRAEGVGVLDAERGPSQPRRAVGADVLGRRSCPLLFCSRHGPTVTAATCRLSGAARWGLDQRSLGGGGAARSRRAPGPSSPARRCCRASTARRCPTTWSTRCVSLKLRHPTEAKAVPLPLGQLSGRAGLVVRRDGRLPVRGCRAQRRRARRGRRRPRVRWPSRGPRVDDVVGHLPEPCRQEGLGQERRLRPIVDHLGRDLPRPALGRHRQPRLPGGHVSTAARCRASGGASKPWPNPRTRPRSATCGRR